MPRPCSCFCITRCPRLRARFGLCLLHGAYPLRVRARVGCHWCESSDRQKLRALPVRTEECWSPAAEHSLYLSLPLSHIVTRFLHVVVHLQISTVMKSPSSTLTTRASRPRGGPTMGSMILIMSGQWTRPASTSRLSIGHSPRCAASGHLRFTH